MVAVEHDQPGMLLMHSLHFRGHQSRQATLKKRASESRAMGSGVMAVNEATVALRAEMAMMPSSGFYVFLCFHAICDENSNISKNEHEKM